MRTVWILGDQLNRNVASLSGVEPGEARILMVESRAKVESKRWHRQRLHLVLAAMRRFAEELRRAGFDVDYRSAASLTEGLHAHRRRYRPDSVAAMEPMSWDGLLMLRRNDVEVVESNQFICHYRTFAEWADGRSRLVMEDFYRWQRRRTGYLMDGAEPAGGRWNYDAENRQPPPKESVSWPEPPRSRLDALDREVLAELPDTAFGDEPAGIWPTSRRAALARLRSFVDGALPRFGPHQDAMLDDEWRLNHSLLSTALNIGLLMPDEVCDAAEEAYRVGRVPIGSAEGFIRQILGWREYVWGVYWLWMPAYRDRNALGAVRPLPPAFTGDAPTDMRCVARALDGIERRAYAHHIQRLMVLGNLALLAGIDPGAMVEWMWASFADGAEWVMLPNVTGMALHADGGLMATKPYAAGGNYINRMSNHCRNCRFDPKRRTGPDACPFTTLYWDFLARHRTRLAANHRMGNQLRAVDRLSDLEAVRRRAAEVLQALDTGVL